MSISGLTLLIAWIPETLLYKCIVGCLTCLTQKTVIFKTKSYKTYPLCEHLLYASVISEISDKFKWSQSALTRLWYSNTWYANSLIYYKRNAFLVHTTQWLGSTVALVQVFTLAFRLKEQLSQNVPCSQWGEEQEPPDGPWAFCLTRPWHCASLKQVQWARLIQMGHESTILLQEGQGWLRTIPPSTTLDSYRKIHVVSSAEDLGILRIVKLLGWPQKTLPGLNQEGS